MFRSLIVAFIMEVFFEQTLYVMYPFGFLTPENGTDRLFRKIGKALPPIYCVITQKSAFLMY
jgi:hypothetical protein